MLCKQLVNKYILGRSVGEAHLGFLLFPVASFSTSVIGLQWNVLGWWGKIKQFVRSCEPPTHRQIGNPSIDQCAWPQALCVCTCAYMCVETGLMRACSSRVCLCFLLKAQSWREDGRHEAHLSLSVLGVELAEWMQCHVPSQTTSTLHRLNLKSSPLRFDPASTPENGAFSKMLSKSE